MKSLFARTLCGMIALNSSYSGRVSFARAVVPRLLPIQLTKGQMYNLFSQVMDLHTGHDTMYSMTRWTHSGHICGYITPTFIKHLQNYPNVFCYDAKDNTLTLHPRLQCGDDHEVRTTEIARVNNELRNKGVIKGWRDELFPASNIFTSQPVALIERASVPYYGVKALGVHVNGYIRNPSTRQISHIWAGKRSRTKSTYPGMLDHIVAGGIPYGISVAENLVKECSEEASIPEALARCAQQAGSVTYCFPDAQGNLKRDEIFCFDLELPVDFVPIPQDGEVESFHLFDVHTVVEKVLEAGPRGFKPNCSLVIIDFLLRHGIISPESPLYKGLVAAVRGGRPV